MKRKKKAGKGRKRKEKEGQVWKGKEKEGQGRKRNEKEVRKRKEKEGKGRKGRRRKEKGPLAVLLGCSWDALGMLRGLLAVLGVPGGAHGALLGPLGVFLEPLSRVSTRIRARTQQNVTQSACGM